MIDYDQAWIAFERIQEVWVATRDSTHNRTSEFREGYRHAYLEALRTFDENAVYRSPADLDAQWLELLRFTESKRQMGISAYGRGFNLGLGDIAEDLERLRADWLG